MHTYENVPIECREGTCAKILIRKLPDGSFTF